MGLEIIACIILLMVAITYYQRGWYYYHNRHQWKKWKAYPQCNCLHCRLYFRPQYDRRYNYYDYPDRDDYRYRQRKTPAPPYSRHGRSRN